MDLSHEVCPSIQIFPPQKTRLAILKGVRLEIIICQKLNHGVRNRPVYFKSNPLYMRVRFKARV